MPVSPRKPAANPEQRREPVTRREVVVLALVSAIFLGCAGLAHGWLVRGLETRQAVADALDDIGFVIGAAEAGYGLRERPGLVSSAIVATFIRGPATGCGDLPSFPGLAAGNVVVTPP